MKLLLLISAALGLPLVGAGALLAQQTGDPESWWAVAREVPALAVLVAVVWIFLREIRRRDSVFLEALKQTSADFKTASEACHEVQKHGIQVSTELREATRRQTKAVDKLEERLQRFMEDSRDG